MGRGNAFIGNFRGKVGNVVGYTIKNSSKKDTQGLRVYQPVVKNPRTIGQSNQRMIVSAASVFYSHFSEILDHSFEGLTEGAKNQARFMKLALMQKQAPYVNKGTSYMIPGLYQISEGGLTATPTFFAEVTSNTSEAYGKMVPNVQGIKLTKSNMYDLDLFLQDNPMFKEGDQITYVLFMKSNTQEGERYYYMLGRGWLNSIEYKLSATMKGISAFANNQASLNGITVGIGDNDNIIFYRNIAEAENIVAAAVIVSRWQNSKWMRNNSTLEVTDSFFDTWYSDERWKEALQSFQSVGNDASSSDLYLNQDGNVKIVSLNVYVVIANGNQARFAGGVDDQGKRFLFANPDKYLYSPEWVPVVKTAGSGDNPPTFYSTSDIDSMYITGVIKKPSLPLYVTQEQVHLSDAKSKTFSRAASSQSRSMKTFAERLSSVDPKPVPVQEETEKKEKTEKTKK